MTIDYAKMTTGIERVFRATHEHGIFQEVLLHFIHFMDAEGNKVRSKLDKQVPGQLYQIMKEGEPGRSRHGEVEYEFPDGTTHRLCALAGGWADLRYGRSIS